MRLNSKLRANALKSREFALSLLSAWLVQPARGNLTQGATTTADSWYDNGTTPNEGFSRCDLGLGDGKFSPYPVGNYPAGHCVAHNNPTVTSTESWFNIDMGSKRVVHTVLIINREDVPVSVVTRDRIYDSILFVGDSPYPKNN